MSQKQKTKKSAPDIELLGMIGISAKELKAKMKSVRKDDLSESNESNAEIAYGYLRALYGDYPEKELVKTFSKDLGLTKPETKCLIQILADDAEFSFGLANAIITRAYKKSSEISTAISSWRETPAADKIINSSRQIEIPEEGDIVGFLGFIADNISPKIKAEICTKFDLYCQSGWAEHDLISQKSESPSVKALIDLASNPSKLEKMSRSELSKILTSRFNELFLDVSVGFERHTDENNNVVEKLVQKQTKKKQTAKDRALELAGPGKVDAIIPSPDGTKVFVGLVTSLKHYKDGTQAIRHLTAVCNSISEGVLCSLAQSSLSINNDAKVIPQLFHTPIVSEEGQKSKKFTQAMNDDELLSKTEKDSINFLSFVTATHGVDYRMAGATPKMNVILAGNPQLFGSKTVWVPEEIPEGERALVAATKVAQAMTAIAKICKKHPDFLAETKGSEMREALHLAVEAFSREWHTSEPPMQLIKKASDSLVEILPQLTGTYLAAPIKNIIGVAQGRMSDPEHSERLAAEEKQQLQKTIAKTDPKNKSTP